MKFIIKNEMKESISRLMRNVGYSFQREDKEKKEMSFIRPLASHGYPRFHIYLKILNSPILKNTINKQEMIFNLHLDQKKPIYKGAPAHSGEYDSEVVKEEAERIKKALQN